MSLARRTFLATGAALAGGAALRGTVRAEARPNRDAAAPQRPAELKMSSQLAVIPGANDKEKVAAMARWGFDGVELPGNIVGRVAEFKALLRGTSMKYTAVCWGSINGDLVSEDPEKRKPAVEQFRKVLSAAGELQSAGVIYVPAFNGQTRLTNQEIRAILLDTLPALGDWAVQCGTRILLEPLNRKEAYFLRQLADAASICRDCKSPGVCLMGDFYHMAIEETSDFAAFVAGGARLHHVHLASRIRVLPGQDDRSFVDGFRGLKWIGYRDYCSFECGVKGDRAVEIPKSMAFLRQQWNEATL